MYQHRMIADQYTFSINALFGVFGCLFTLKDLAALSRSFIVCVMDGQHTCQGALPDYRIHLVSSQWLIARLHVNKTPIIEKLYYASATMNPLQRKVENCHY